MKVILLENLRRIGSIGEIIDVKRGFARNFLISNKKALYASKENIAEVEKIKSELGKKDAEKKKEAKKISEQISILVKKQNVSQNDLNQVIFSLPNIPLDDVPIGKDEKSNKLIKKETKKILI
mgnify:CR=1 FL=1